MTRSGHDTVRDWIWQGEKLRAAWGSVRLLEENASDLLALWLGSCALADLDRRSDAVAGLRDCAGAAADSGDVSLALACFLHLRRLGEDGADVVEQITWTYHRSSPRIERGRRPAPPLPRRMDPPPEAIDREAVLGQLRAAVATARDQIAATRKMAFDPPPIPAAPLLSSLSADNLRTVLEAFEEVRLGVGERLVTQGEDGDAVYLIVAGWAEVVRRARSGEETALRRLGPGSVVGEVALVTSAPRVASVRAETGLIALRLTRAVVEDLATREPSLADELVAFCQQKMLANLLDASPVLQRLDETDRKPILDQFDRRVVPAGEELVRQGEPSPGLFLVVVGAAEVLRSDGEGGWVRLAVLGPAEVFGEISLVLKRPATATVRMLYDGAVLLLPRERFLPVVERHPGLLAELYRVAEEREEETRSLLGRPSEATDDLTLV
jgi:CRP-like cAMP-binding protein